MAGRQKLEAQRRLLGAGCAVLECAVERGVGFCMRDCDEFPCDAFARRAYPYGEGFLGMQARRRAGLEGNAAHWPDNAAMFWEMLERRPADEVRRCAGVDGDGTTYTVPSLHESWTVDVANRSVSKRQGAFGGEWDRQLPFLLVAYLTKAGEGPLAGEMVPPRDLVPGQDVFRGKNAIEVGDLEAEFGDDAESFAGAASALGGEATDLADASTRFMVLPKLPVSYLLWLRDEEFPARVGVLVDANAPRHFPTEGIANCVNLLTRRLLLAARERRRG
jgi:uncharacterized protein (DUF3820 family)